MKKTDLLCYETPLLEVEEAAVEQGFAGSQFAVSQNDPTYNGFEPEEKW